ncbi:MAG: hypothetical protein AB7I52_06980, partial [Rhizobiaceae bacterium]
GLVPAHADTISAMPDETGKSIFYTPCNPSEEASECLVYMITCQPNEVYGSGLELTVISQGDGEQPDVLPLARSFLDKPYGEQKLAFGIGGKAVEIPVNAVIVYGNELNGGWDLSLRSMDPGAFYDALTDASSGSVSAAVGSFTAQLADTKDEGAALMKFKKACTE